MRRFLHILLALPITAAFATVLGCGPNVLTGNLALDQACSSDAEFFESRVFEPILKADCAQCHNAEGPAATTRFVLSSAPDADLETLRSMAKEQIGGRPLLLLKPTQAISHGGGGRFMPDSEPYLALFEMIYRFDHPGDCRGFPKCSEKRVQPGAAPMLRMNAEQFSNTVQDLFDGQVQPSSRFPKTHLQAGFSTFISANVVSESAAEQIMTAAEEISEEARARMWEMLACEAGSTERDCFEAFVRRFGARAYRRPLTEEEVSVLMSFYQDTTDSEVLRDQFTMILQVILQSPQFLYVDYAGQVERGTEQQDGVVRLDSYALASRLSYLLWNTMPDAQLFSLAQAGALEDRGQLLEEARRMLQDPKAGRLLARFHSDWLGLNELESLSKDEERFPWFGSDVATAMQEEVNRLVQRVVFEQGGGFEALMTTRTTFINSALEPVYGLSAGSTRTADFSEVTLGPERAGLLTTSGFLATRAHRRASSPIARGTFVLRNILCEPIELPVGLDVTSPPEVAGGTIRERLAAHRREANCASCHDRIDPIGFAFENFDAVGAHRTTYLEGQAVDSSGYIEELGGAFNSASELMHRLAGNQRARDCYATSWFRYFKGRFETIEDRCAIDELKVRFEDSGGDIQDLVIGIVESDAFFYKALESE